MPGGGKEQKKKEEREGTALDWKVARIRLISLTIPAGGTFVIDLGSDPSANQELRDEVRRLLVRLQKVEIIGHRLGFDLCFLEHEFGWRPEKVWDSWVAAELLYNDDWELCNKELRPRRVRGVPGPSSLAQALKVFLGAVLDKELGGGALSNFGADCLTRAQMTYSAADTYHLPALVLKLRETISAAGLSRIAQIEMALVPVFAHMEIVGIPLRADLLAGALETLDVKIKGVDQEIAAAMVQQGFDPTLDYSKVSKNYLGAPKKAKPINFNGDNLKTHYFALFEARTGLKLPRTEKGQMSFTVEVLESIDDPVARLYAARAELNTLRIGINQRLPFITGGRVHPVHNQMSANTGRISTEEPAMSNLPRSGDSPLRRAVEAPLGYVIVQGDLSLIEVRAQAHFASEEKMIELFNLPGSDPRSDIYRLFASWVRNCPVQEIPAKGELRTQAKPVVLGTAYLMGLETFIQYARGYGVHYTVQEAEAVRTLYFKNFKGIKRWHDRAWARANSNLVTEGRTHLGRRRLVLKIPGDRRSSYRQVQAQVNYIIQGACTDGLKLGLLAIAAALPSGAELIHSVHDEVLVLCRIEQAEQVRETVTRVMVEAYQEAFGQPLKVPIVFEVEVIQNWSQKK